MGRAGFLFALAAGALALFGIPSMILRALVEADLSVRTLVASAIVDAGVSTGVALIAIALGIAGRRASKQGQATNGALATTAVSLGWVVVVYAILFRLVIGLLIAYFIGSGAAGDLFGGLLNFLFAVPN